MTTIDPEPAAVAAVDAAPRIRAYERDDEEAVIALWQRTWQTAYPRHDFAARVAWWRERWRTELVPMASVVVAEARGPAGPEILGFVTIDESGYLDQIVVAPEAWGTPVATALLDEAKRVAPTGIALHVNKDNHRAIRFYEKQGFSIGGEDVNPRSQSPVFMMCWRP
ncbi:GNAT family N-acetyltransferase [Rhodoplanes sp. TEM]|uniref:GNAT family N-acetyltransferase n=1 Tax=Rhodoplanes tepidamans TaxID=200616 RepID=A0ABT5JEF2_RHOTP|nr:MULTISPECIES: GNAT family N-acetyltransferase [Rhodoplanes]MDC7788053.1 GNAT family N-acetyltransferase [Rhodoplanes tepidamans]MDC7987536.1 GNAT family N-acetyltransferase [Rhodoplanes sp. TEM]MDQ0353958.1 putative acetyltransferase [Rhodoplanes tepidamans]